MPIICNYALIKRIFDTLTDDTVKNEFALIMLTAPLQSEKAFCFLAQTTNLLPKKVSTRGREISKSIDDTIMYLSNSATQLEIAL